MERLQEARGARSYPWRRTSTHLVSTAGVSSMWTSLMAGRRAGSDVSAKGLTYSQSAKYSFEVLRPEATELDVCSQQVHADDL